jgi:hypothetical protein
MLFPPSIRAAGSGGGHGPVVCRPSARRSICEVQTKVTPTYIDVHAALSKNVATNQNVIGREVIEHGKVADELNPILEPN